MIKAVFFDMNGIIINDEHIHESAFTKTVKKYGIELSHQDYLLCCAGKTDRRGYEDMAKQFDVNLNVDDLLKEKSQIYLDLFPENKKTYQGVIELVKKMSQSYILALTSSSSRAEVDLVLDEFNIRDSFALTISADDIKNGKPDPEPYIKTAQLLGVATEDSVVIEDAVSGIKSAKAAGCYCVAVTTTHAKEDLYEADVIVEDFSEIDQSLLDNIKK